MINMNYEMILRYIYENESTLEQIMKNLCQNDIDSKLNTVRFIIDLCNVSKQLLIDSKQAFFTQLVQPGLFSLLVDIMMYKESVPAPDLSASAATPAPPAQPSAAPSGGDESRSKAKPKPPASMLLKLRIEGDQTVHGEYEVGKLELLKVHVAEILTGCFQILPSKVTRRATCP